MGKRELETVKRSVRFQLCFAQRGLAVVSLHRHEYLPPVTGRRRRLQLRHFASTRLRFIKFSGNEKDPSEIKLSRDRQRIEFHCLARLSLGFFHFPQINDDSGKQIIRGGISRRKFLRSDLPRSPWYTEGPRRRVFLPEL